MAALSAKVEQLETKLNQLAKYSKKTRQELEQLVIEMVGQSENTEVPKPPEIKTTSTVSSLPEILPSSPPEIAISEAENIEDLTDFEFRVERFLLLTGFYTDEVEIQGDRVYTDRLSAEAFLERYQEGDRDFSGVNLAGADLKSQALNRDSELNLSGANLRKANLEQSSWDRFIYANIGRVADRIDRYLLAANLNNVDLCLACLKKANLVNVQLHKSKLIKADLKEVKLMASNVSYANLMFANLSEGDLYKTNFSHANLNNACLNQANLQQANLSYASLKRIKAIKADLQQADLSYADLRHADLTKANLFGANLEGANLEHTILKHTLYDSYTIFPEGFNPKEVGAYLIAPHSKLRGADLSETNLRDVNLTGADLAQANLTSANFQNVTLNSASLYQANLSKALIVSSQLIKVDLSASNLAEAFFTNTFLTASNLNNCNLNKANIEGTILRGVSFYDAQLYDIKTNGSTDFDGAKFQEVNLIGFQLYGSFKNADFTRSQMCSVFIYAKELSGSNFTGADLRGAVFPKGVNLENANFTNAQIAGIQWNEAKLDGAIMPDGTKYQAQT
ncbi:MAG: pentapeptide repeat-containing protein [Jaaginema sp. PMC 1080.18]|nr:pentapeptide repeat-containing protein [Jaaginema sp. PMC 1080.18]